MSLREISINLFWLMSMSIIMQSCRPIKNEQKVYKSHVWAFIDENNDYFEMYESDTCIYVFDGSKPFGYQYHADENYQQIVKASLHKNENLISAIERANKVIKKSIKEGVDYGELSYNISYNRIDNLNCFTNQAIKRWKRYKLIDTLDFELINKVKLIKEK